MKNCGCSPERMCMDPRGMKFTGNSKPSPLFFIPCPCRPKRSPIGTGSGTKAFQEQLAFVDRVQSLLLHRQLLHTETALSPLKSQLFLSAPSKTEWAEKSYDKQKKKPNSAITWTCGGNWCTLSKTLHFFVSSEKEPPTRVVERSDSLDRR